MERILKWTTSWWWIFVVALVWAGIAAAQGPGVSPAPGVQLQDEGTGAGRVQILNCVGAGVVCTKSGVTGTVTVGGGTSFALTEIEIDFGASAGFVITATVVDAAVTTASKIIFLQSGIAATGKQADENQMDYIVCNATPGTGNFLLECASIGSVTHGKFKVNYAIG